MLLRKLLQFYQNNAQYWEKLWETELWGKILDPEQIHENPHKEWHRRMTRVSSQLSSSLYGLSVSFNPFSDTINLCYAGCALVGTADWQKVSTATALSHANHACRFYLLFLFTVTSGGNGLNARHCCPGREQCFFSDFKNLCRVFTGCFCGCWRY